MQSVQEEIHQLDMDIEENQGKYEIFSLKNKLQLCTAMCLVSMKLKISIAFHIQ